MRKFLFTVVCGLGAVAMGDTAFREGGSTFGLYEEKDPARKDNYLYQERMRAKSILEAVPVTKADTNLLFSGTEKLLNEMIAKGRFGALRALAHQCRTARRAIFAPCEDLLYAHELCAAWRSGDHAGARALAGNPPPPPAGNEPPAVRSFRLHQRIHGTMTRNNPPWVDANGTWSFLKELSDPHLAEWRKSLDDRSLTSLAEMRMGIARALRDRAGADAVYAEARKIARPETYSFSRLCDCYVVFLSDLDDFRAILAVLEAMPAERRPHDRLAREYLRADRRTDAVREIDAALADPKLKPEARFEFAFLRAYATAATPEAFVASLGGLAADGLDELNYFRAFRRATRTLYGLVCDEKRSPFVKAAAEYSRAALMHPEARLAYEVGYLPNAPRTAGSALAGDVFSKLRTENRFAPYQTYYWGERVNEEKRLKGTPPPHLEADKPGEEACAAVAYDASGLHFYLKMNDPEAWKAQYGLARGFGLEFEIQPGDGAISHWIMHTGTKPRSDTKYELSFPSVGYRFGEDCIESDAESTETCHVVHVYVPWVTWDGKLPEDGETWRLSVVIDWGRNFAALGGGSVHEVQRGLAITFRIPQEARAAIRRGLLNEAAFEYRRVRDKWESAEFWSDPHLGDEPFYNSVVKPYLEATDAVDAKIREGKLSDAEVESVLKQSFADLADFRFLLDAKRTAWIRQSLFRLSK